MGTLHNLADFRSKAPPKLRSPRRSLTPTVPVYYCTRCNVDRFLLSPLGAVCCANCGAVMPNIHVSET